MRYGRSSFSNAYFRRPSMRRSFGGSRLILGIIIAVFSLISYFGSSEFNPVTGEKQYLSMTTRQEIALGLNAVPEMMSQFGGLAPDARAQARVDSIGERLLAQSKAGETKWRFEFHLLGDRKTVNAFALPGGQIFITQALYDELHTDAQLAGVLAHEIGHVVARHSAQRIAKQNLTSGLSSAIMIGSGDYDAGRMAQLVGQMVNMTYGREDEIQSDVLGVRFMAEAGYDPRAMVQVMKVLEKASGGSRGSDFFSTHPNPDNRIARIEAAIKELFPSGVPQNFQP